MTAKSGANRRRGPRLAHRGQRSARERKYQQELERVAEIRQRLDEQLGTKEEEDDGERP